MSQNTTLPTLEPTSWTRMTWRGWVAQSAARCSTYAYIAATLLSLYECHKLRRGRAAGLYIGQVTLLSFANRYQQRNVERQIAVWHSETKMNIQSVCAIIAPDSDQEPVLPDDDELPRLAEALWRIGRGRRIQEINSVATAAYRLSPLAVPASHIKPQTLAAMESAIRDGDEDRMRLLILGDFTSWKEALREHATLFEEPPAITFDLLAIGTHGTALTVTTLVALAWLIRHGHLRPLDTYAIYLLSRLRLLPRRFLPKAPVPIPIKVH